VRTGARVHLAIPATGIHSRRNRQDLASRNKDLEALRQDCYRAAGVLGILPEHIYLGEFPDNAMDRYPLLDAVHWIEKIIGSVAPDLLLTHHRYCTNIDHQYCHNAAVVAARPSVERHIPILCAEIPSSTGYLRPSGWEPNLYVEIAQRDLDAKIAASQIYEGEARPDPHPRSKEVLAALAKLRGSESGFMFAEAFMVQRIFG